MNHKQATQASAGTLNNALTDIEDGRAMVKAGQALVKASTDTAITAALGLGFTLDPATKHDKDTNKDIISAFDTAYGRRFSAYIARNAWLDKDEFTDYHRDVLKRYKALPRGITESNVVKVLASKINA